VVGREIHRSPEPAIVAGDLNDVAWSYTTRLFQRISGLMDPRLGRGMFNSFHARNPLMRWPLDHVFFDAEFRLCRIERLRSIGSDHFPILVELSFEPEGADEQEARAPMPRDRAAARRMIREAKASAMAPARPDRVARPDLGDLRSSPRPRFRGWENRPEPC